MGYLVCEKCDGYYELQPGESVKDFELCRCGGKLKFVNSIEIKNSSKDVIKTKDKNIDKKVTEISNDLLDRPLRLFEITKEKASENTKEKNVKNLISVINSNVNIAAVLIGLAFSVLVFIVLTFLSTALLGSIIKSVGIIIFSFFLLICSCLGGGIATGFVACHNDKEAVINGFILSSVWLIILGIIISIVLIYLLGTFSAIASSFGTSSAATSSNPAGNIILNLILYIISGFITIALSLIAGAFGGIIGVKIKEELKISL